MIIDPKRTYRTRDGRPVRLYAVDGETNSPIHGAIWYPDFGWGIDHWDKNGINMGPNELHCCDLIEVTLADELTEQIPWEALRPEIQWVAMQRTGAWYGFRGDKPEIRDRYWCDYSHNWVHISDYCVTMPFVPADRWRETLIQRPEDK